MPIKEIVITTPQQFNDSLSKITSGEVVAIIDSNTTKVREYESIMSDFLKDDKLGFIFTDILVNINGVSYTKYFNSKELYSVPFFLRKPHQEIIVQEGDIKSQIMQQMISRGYSFEHIAEPYFCDTIDK
jgi:hypothetical protein